MKKVVLNSSYANRQSFNRAVCKFLTLDVDLGDILYAMNNSADEQGIISTTPDFFNELSTLYGISQSKFYRKLPELVKSKHLKRLKHGQYQLNGPCHLKEKSEFQINLTYEASNQYSGQNDKGS